jgi:hypothetical protein
MGKEKHQKRGIQYTFLNPLLRSSSFLKFRMKQKWYWLSSADKMIGCRKKFAQCESVRTFISSIPIFSHLSQSIYPQLLTVKAYI